MSNLKDRALRAAERFVGHRGYDIVSTAYKLQDGGQIDIVAEDGDALVFIDVNARRDTNEGFPSDSITERTRERREKAAIQWFRSEGRAIATARFASTTYRFWCWVPTAPS